MQEADEEWGKRERQKEKGIAVSNVHILQAENKTKKYDIMHPKKPITCTSVITAPFPSPAPPLSFPPASRMLSVLWEVLGKGTRKMSVRPNLFFLSPSLPGKLGTRSQDKSRPLVGLPLFFSFLQRK